MKALLILMAALFLMVGVVWILQGIGVLPGSFMTGQIEWAYAGVISALIGGGLLWAARRRR